MADLARLKAINEELARIGHRRGWVQIGESATFRSICAAQSQDERLKFLPSLPSSKPYNCLARCRSQ